MGAHATNCCSQHRHLRCIGEIHLKMLFHLKMGSYGESDVKT